MLFRGTPATTALVVLAAAATALATRTAAFDSNPPALPACGLSATYEDFRTVSGKLEAQAGAVDIDSPPLFVKGAGPLQTIVSELSDMSALAIQCFNTVIDEEVLPKGQEAGEITKEFLKFVEVHNAFLALFEQKLGGLRFDTDRVVSALIQNNATLWDLSHYLDVAVPTGLFAKVGQLLVDGYNGAAAASRRADTPPDF